MTLCFLGQSALAEVHDYQVNFNNDDAEETVSSGSMSLSSSDLELISDSGTNQLVGIRFRSVRIPQGTTITNAVLEFETDETNSGTTSLTIAGEDIDDAPIFTGGNSNISNRTTTTATVSWSPGAWNTVSERHLSPDVSSIVQEIVDRVGWSSGNDMVFIITGSGERTAEAHNGESANAPVLRVEWDGQMSVPGGEICYGISDSNDHLVLIDTSDGTVDTDVGDTGGSAVEALAIDPDDYALYAADGDELGRINTDTGEMIRLTQPFGTGGGSVGSITFDDVDSLAFDPTDGTLYGVDARGGSDALFQIDPSTGAHVEDAFGSGTDYVLITGTFIGTQIDDIAIDPDDGTMYASDTSNSQLLTINTSTGAATAVGGFGGSIDMEGLGFRFDNVLYGTAGERLYTINTSTGAATQVGSGDTLTTGTDFESFDCHFTSTSRAVVTGVDKLVQGDRVVVRWHTVSEEGTTGFNLHRWNPTNQTWVAVSQHPVPALWGSPQGGTYWVADPGADPSASDLYTVTEIETGDRFRLHGPFQASFRDDALEPGLDPDVYSRARAWQPVPRPGASASNTDVAPSAKSLRPSPAAEPGDRAGVKIETTGEGLVRVDVEPLASTLGVSASIVRQRLVNGGLRLLHQGADIAWWPAPDGEGLIFYATPVDDPLAPTNVYRLQLGRGQVMAERLAPGVDPSFLQPAPFEARRVVEEDVFAGLAAQPDPDGDYWFWLGFAAGHPVVGSHTVPVDLDGLAGSGGSTGAGAAVIEAEVFGVSDVGPHRLELVINGRSAGERQFVGLGAHNLTWQAPHELLRDGTNDFEWIAHLDPSTAFSFLYLDHLAVRYTRLPRAADGRRLELRTPRPGANRLDGFARPDVLVFDIENPRRPIVLANGSGAGVWAQPDGSFSTTILGLGPGRRAVASTTDAVPSVAVTPWRQASPDLSSSRRAAEYVVLAPPSLTAVAEELADYRRSRGLSATVVDLEELANELGHGVLSPRVITEFFTQASQRWGVPPRYGLLLGRGTFDHLDRLGIGDQRLPPLLAKAPGGLFPAPGRFLDDGVDIALGRLPVTDAAEARRYLDKLIAFETGSAGSGRGLVVADLPAPGARFADDGLRLIEASSSVVSSDLLQVSADGTTLPPLAGRLADGVDWLTFVGHGSSAAWGIDSFFGLGDLESLAITRPPIVLAATCLSNRSDVPGFPALGEAWVLSEGGSIAVLGPTSTTAHTDAVRLLHHFWRSFDDGTPQRLGDAVLNARRRAANDPGTAAILPLWSLLGDPAIELPNQN